MNKLKKLVEKQFSNTLEIIKFIEDVQLKSKSTKLWLDYQKLMTLPSDFQTYRDTLAQYILEREVSYFRHSLLDFEKYLIAFKELTYLNEVNDNYIFNYYLNLIKSNHSISFKDAKFEKPENQSFVENLRYQSVIQQIKEVFHDTSQEESKIDVLKS